MQELDYTTHSAEMYYVKTIVPYADEPELRLYDVPADELSGFVVALEDEQTAERLVNIEPIDATSGEQCDSLGTISDYRTPAFKDATFD